MAIGFAVGGEPGSRLSRKLAMPVSGDTLLRMIRAATFEAPEAPRVVGIDDWECVRTSYPGFLDDLEHLTGS